MRRVVVTGMGIISPVGRGLKRNWEGVTSGKSAITNITNFELTDDYPSKVAGQVPRGKDNPELFDADLFMHPKDQRKNDPFIVFGVAAGIEAVEDSGWKPESEEDMERTGVLMGSGIGGISKIAETSIILHEQGPRKVSPFFIPGSLINLISGHISIKYGFKGPNHSVVTACATSTHAIGDAARLIMYGDADVMVAGGAEAAVCPVPVAGFSQMKALSSSFNDTPQKASRPWDKDRDGFVIAEGAGAVVLEEYEHAKARGAKIYGELIGYGLSGDAYHITAPHSEGDGAYRAMKSALKNAGIAKEEINYVNAHGTSTPLGDELEIKAVKRLFENHAYDLCVTSTKSCTGHLLGAAGVVEAIYSIMAMNNGVVPPTLNLDNPSDSCDLNFVPHTAIDKELNVVMSNSFGFGGTNASLIFKKV